MHYFADSLIIDISMMLRHAIAIIIDADAITPLFSASPFSFSFAIFAYFRFR
jgi:hypothetical protein